MIMRLTRKTAIEKCKELWKWCAETGGEKHDWPGWKKLRGDEAHHSTYCWFCMYVEQKRGSCEVCPYNQKYGFCLDSCYGEWAAAATTSTRKKYAKLFYNQIKTLK